MRVYTTANAYIADVSPPEKRAANFGLTGAAFGIGFVVGPAIGGLLGQYGVRVPFFAAAALAVANALPGFAGDERIPAAGETAPQIRNDGAPIRWDHFWHSRRYPMVLGFVGVLIMMRLAHDANPVIWSYYVYLKFRWTTAQLGWALAFLGTIMAFVFGFLTRIAIPKLGEH